MPDPAELLGHLSSLWIVPVVGAIALLAARQIRRRALRAVETSPPSDDEREAAREAGRRLAARGTIGLVLGGGGAKGAYQLGCWQALRECGVSSFGAIAGTSVGALNAVLVAQDDHERAEAIWRDMRFGRVLRPHWHALIAVAIRIVLLVPYLGKHMFPARAIPVTLWRAVRRYQDGMARDGNPLHLVRAALDLYGAFIRRPDSTDLISNLVLAAIALAGLSAWWVAAAPLLTLVAAVIVVPVLALLLVSYASAFAVLLDQLSTRLVLASNEPLHQLLRECVDVERLRRRPHPLFATLATLREVTRGDAATVEYVPTHFDVRREGAERARELILQSAGLPEIFPARRFDGVSYVDGGIVDNEPLAALWEASNHALIVVITLDWRKNDARVRDDFAANLERLGRRPPTDLPPLLVLAPSRPLGNMLTGTLDFGAERARALMRLGYADTIGRLANLDNGRPRRTTPPPAHRGA